MHDKIVILFKTVVVSETQSVHDPTSFIVMLHRVEIDEKMEGKKSTGDKFL